VRWKRSSLARVGRRSAQMSPEIGSNERANQQQRVSVGVEIGIWTARQADGIGLRISSYDGIVVPQVVVYQRPSQFILRLTALRERHQVARANRQ
jgi:hypothetical protein